MDYDNEEEIYKLLTSIFLAGLIFWIAGRNFGLGLIAGFFGIILYIYWWSRAEEKNPWEILDALCIPLVIFLFFVGIGLFLGRKDFWELRYSIVGIIVWLTFLFNKKKYRSFSWYKSGKTGFLFGFSSFLTFLLLLLLAFLKNFSLYWQSGFYLIAVILSLAAIYIRSGRKIKEDLKFLKKIN